MTSDTVQLILSRIESVDTRLSDMQQDTARLHADLRAHMVDDQARLQDIQHHISRFSERTDFHTRLFQAVGAALLALIGWLVVR